MLLDHHVELTGVEQHARIDAAALHLLQVGQVAGIERRLPAPVEAQLPLLDVLRDLRLQLRELALVGG